MCRRGVVANMVEAGIKRGREGCVPTAVTLVHGQTEGEANRLKLIKRQIYGWASLDLLKQPVFAV